MPQTRSTSTRLVALLVAVAIGLTGFVAGTGPAGAALTVEPTIIGPSGTSVGANPVLQWEPLDGITKYRVQISTSSSFGSFVLNTEVSNVSVSPYMELPIGTVYWRVAGVDSTGVGPYATTSFTRTQQEGPELVAPADETTLQFPSEPVTLRWEPVLGYKSYKVEVDDASDFIGAQSFTTDGTSWTLRNTQPLGQTFYWRVQGQATATGVNTEYSETWRYSLAWANGSPTVPELTSPLPGATVTDVVFRWNPVPGAAKYEIQVSPNGDWANNIAFEATVQKNSAVKGTSISPPVTLNNASYFWRVRAVSARTPTVDFGPWSPDGRQFTRSWADVPLLVAPDDGELTAEDFLLQWDPVPHAGAYEVQVGTDVNFSPDTYETCTTNHTDWAPYWKGRTTDPDFPARPGECDLSDEVGDRRVFLRQGQRYYWRVRGLDVSAPSLTNVSAYGRFSDTHSFIYAPDPGAPLPIGPHGTVEVPKLQWEAVPGVERYYVEVDVDGERQISAEVHGTSFVPALANPIDEETDLPRDAEVTWKVRALQVEAPTNSATLGAGPTVTGTTFTLTDVETTDAAPDPGLVAPASGASAVHPEFDWTPVENAHHYRVHLYPAGAPSAEVLGDPEESGTRKYPWRSSFTPIVPINPGAYEWQVVAYTKLGGVISSSEKRPITIAPLALAVPTAPASCAEGVSCTAHEATPLMRWEPVEGAAFYRVHVALDPDFTNVKWVFTTTQAALRPNEALPDNQAGQSYHWFVQPCRTRTLCGRFNSTVFPTARAFRKASRPITLLAPSDGATVPDLVTFSWRAPSELWEDSDPNDDLEARHYKIQVSTDAGFSTILDEALVDQTTYTPYGKTYPEGPLYWRVQAVDGTQNLLTFSTSRVVHKRSPLIEVTSPANGDEVDDLPVIQWEPQPFAASYQVEIYENGDTSWTAGNRIDDPFPTQLTALTLAERLPPGTYAYRVRRVDVDNRFGPWSSDPPNPGDPPSTGDRRTFVVVGAAPSPTAPANDTVFTSPRVRLEWDPVPGAAKYKVETSTTAGFGSTHENQTTVMTSWSLLKPYTNGTFYWRVSAIDAQDTVIGTSPIRRFVHDLRRPTAAIQSVSAGPASATVRWTAQPSAIVGPITSFVITPYIGTEEQTPVTVPGTATEAIVTGLINETTYRFTVTPYDANGIGTESTQSGTVKPRAVIPFSTVDRFIDRQFRDFFGRPPTSTEMSSFRTQVQNGTLATEVIESLWTNPAHANVMPQITRLYSAFYLRIPDFGGLDYWAQQRRGGKSLGSAAEFFAKSAEFRALYGNKTNAQYVDLVYTNVLGRPASTADRSYWTAELNAGRRTRGSLMIGFSEAAEYKNKFQHDINAALVMLEMLRRTPTVDERDDLADALEGGQTLQETFAAVMATEEYDDRAN